MMGTKRKAQELGASEVVDCGAYLTGLDWLMRVEFCSCAVTDDELVFLMGKREMGRLARADIRAVHAEDKTTMEKRVTATRVLALGLFSLAARKKTKNVEWSVIIEHEHGAVAFEFTGPFTQIRANACAAGLRRAAEERGE